MKITTDVLLDTNVLLRTQFDKSVHVTNATRAAVELRRSGDRLVTTMQNIAEFVNVATRPEANKGLGIPLSEALLRSQYFEQSFDVFFENVSSFNVWKSIVNKHQVKGKQVHDARIVSAMLANGTHRILTFNTKDFIRFPELEVLHPDQVLGSS